jgi:hypothetical protein
MKLFIMEFPLTPCYFHHQMSSVSFQRFTSYSLNIILLLDCLQTEHLNTTTRCRIFGHPICSDVRHVNTHTVSSTLILMLKLTSDTCLCYMREFSDLIPIKRKRFFSSPKRSHRLRGPPSPILNGYRGFSPAESTHPPSAEI